MLYGINTVKVGYRKVLNKNRKLQIKMPRPYNIRYRGTTQIEIFALTLMAKTSSVLTFSESMTFPKDPLPRT
jgi:hypothetical protein